MSESLSIPPRFNGPRASGNGGYCAGVVAGFIDGAAAEVGLRAPVPLDTSLAVERAAVGSVRVLDGETLIAEGRADPEFALDVPSPVGVEAAREASARYRGLPDGEFSRCFVCGRARDDSFEVFAGAVEGRDAVASPWTPPDWAAGDDGIVRPALVWAVLDCPTFFGLYAWDDELPLSVLGRMTARVDEPVRPGEEHVVIGWPIGRDGRKHHAGSAVLSADGRVLAAARALLIAPRAG